MMQEVLTALTATSLAVLAALAVAGILASIILAQRNMSEAAEEVTDEMMEAHGLRLAGLRSRDLWVTWVLVGLAGWGAARIGLRLVAGILDWAGFALLWSLLLGHFVWAVRVLKHKRQPTPLLRYARHVVIWSGLAILGLGWASYELALASQRAGEVIAR